MKCVVSGGTGFLGRHVVRALVAAGHEVRAIVRREAFSLEREGAELVRGDVLDSDSLARACAGADACVHMAGRVQHKGEASEVFELNVEGTRHMLAAARAAGLRRFVHVSSSGTIAVSTDERIVDERAPYALETVRRWPYYLSKIYAEKLAFEENERGGFGVVVVSPSLLLGPEDESLASSQVLLRFLRGEVPFAPPGGINFVDVRDAAAGVAAALERGRAGERYLLGGPNMTLEAFFVLLAKVTGKPAPSLRATPAVQRATWRTLSVLEALGGFEGDESVAYSMAEHFWYLDPRKAQRELDFAARPPEQTLRDAVAWIRSQGPLPEGEQTLGALFRSVRRFLPLR
ncbi:MAG: NAD-dependent epimerase/dehydratase family protein [Planctomycetota bacterium]|nr:MAG: NAD-dependent epimerase/dehydratase family protein [Planctomycetota bacterium]